MSRKFPRPIRRIVIKLGSSVIATDHMRPRRAIVGSLLRQIHNLRRKGVEVVLVSSGAIVLGMGELRTKQRPNDLAVLQASAAIGQNILMRLYSDLFRRYRISCAQVLLTWDDFDDRVRYNNARKTLKAILEQNAIPIINENDTISTEEIRFGDNDRLSALVATLVDADLLLLLSDVEGLYEMKDGRRRLYKEIKEITAEIEGVAKDSSKKNMARGGMIAKLQAVKVANQARIPCVVANAETKDVVSRVLQGERIGTLFMEKEERLISRKHWISFGAKPKGRLTIDEGAVKALLEKGKSLLLPGIISWEGHFDKDDVVIVTDKQNQEIARGMIAYSVSDLHTIEDKRGKAEVIHRDNLVLCKR